ncbi:phosphate signaling complex protein PhoU [Candidatus Magnetominusculus xianensis]|uniref:Phosphate-specific transport system accessory protein PhoU n=1 Tax=Candidatus Magnetominusculus xianensis TaxID=1748249 RepID=A0ABR5SC02_9BACT|nr:phosphate signaling complex protein PhoU [Candidatus Magnetominusculus xianensis]KWT78402.1 PhoU family transcriptional regulator [Candidatus Magnetominusculus xianensis]MBF0403170.1 phosphate signaling complex protein PhoU [Nitrospirota bacterium]
MAIRDDELKHLKEMILKMASLVESSIRDSIRALVTQEPSIANAVITADHTINAFDVQIDEECIRLIARRQPVGRDLRFITTGMKITSDLERIADHAVNIAERALKLFEVHPMKAYSDLSRMREIAQRMVKDAIDSFVNEDKALAQEVIDRDAEVDDLNSSVVNELMLVMTKEPGNIVQASQLIYISRNIERIGDHATNIAEMVIYMVDGRIVRHMADITGQTP